MSFNPLKEKGMPLEKQLRSWSQLNTLPYDKHNVDPYTRCRIITMNGIEVEGAVFSHQWARHTANMDLRRNLAMIRRIEQQQQKAVNWLIPADESFLEVTIGYEQVAVDLTAALAQSEPDPYVKQVLEFGLLEDFDHLYRYANLMEMLEGKKAEDIVGNLTEVIPGRPTVAEHRHPFDDVRHPVDSTPMDPLSMAKALIPGKRPTNDPLTALHVLTITAAEQQTMNYYMNFGNRPMHPLARALYLEIGQIEEQHVTQYESLMDPRATWFEQEVLHQYNECYLYYSFMMEETDPRIKSLWELHLEMEIEHLRIACEMLEKHEGKDPQLMLPKSLPQSLAFKSNKEYVRRVLAEQVDFTADLDRIVPLRELPKDHRYFFYQAAVNDHGESPSEDLIREYVGIHKTDYRLETEGPHPVPRLRRPVGAGRA